MRKVLLGLSAAVGLTMPGVAGAGGIQPVSMYDTIATIDWFFAGDTDSGGRYEISVRQDTRPATRSGFELGYGVQFWDFDEEFTGAPPSSEPHGLTATIALEIDGVRSSDVDDNPALASNLLYVQQGVSGTVDTDELLPGEDVVSLNLDGNDVSLFFFVEDSVSHDEWPDPPWLLGVIPVEMPELSFWGQGASAAPVFQVEIDGQLAPLQFPDTFDYELVGIRFVPEPGTGVLLLSGLAMVAATRRRRR